MKSPQYAIMACLLALFAASCTTAELIPGAGYSARDAFYRGYDDGRSDRVRGLAHNPHINEDSMTLPSAHRLEYTWGYTEGFRYPYARSRYSSSK